jgi:hypothetical protein
MTPAADPFVPRALRRRRAPPIFHLRPEALGGVRAWRREIEVEGLCHYGLADLRQEALRTLKRLWAAEEYETGVSTLQGLWARIDAGETLGEAEAAALAELTREIAEASPQFRRMIRKQLEFGAGSARVAVGLVLYGYEGIPVPFRIARLSVDAATIAELERWLSDTFGKAGETAWAELADECVRRAATKASPITTPPKPRRARRATPRTSTPAAPAS